jgi:HlyD family secretion protein
MKTILIAGLILTAFSCNSNKVKFDASGTFESDELVVSSEANGRITSLNLEEGNLLKKGQVVGTIDNESLQLQKEQVEASISALKEKTSDVAPQIRLLEDQKKVQQSQLTNMLQERARTENLVKADAATKKQLDDINAQIDVLQKQISVTEQQINVQKNNVATQNRSILSEKNPLEKKSAQLQDQIQKSNIVNPIDGTVIMKYAELGEVTAQGKALYKIADLSTIILRAYVTGIQLPNIKTGQQVKVLIDSTESKYKEYPGTIEWISDKAEFTPKTIQTKEERANLVYAIKIRVKNDGYLKIGMYGEVQLNAK